MGKKAITLLDKKRSEQGLLIRSIKSYSHIAEKKFFLYKACVMLGRDIENKISSYLALGEYANFRRIIAGCFPTQFANLHAEYQLISQMQNERQPLLIQEKNEKKIPRSGI